MVAIAFRKQIHQLAEKAGKLQMAEWLRQRIQFSGNDDANEIFVSGFEGRDATGRTEGMNDQFSVGAESGF
jgi:hypothetical protein